jgi:hypothetical protein
MPRYDSECFMPPAPVASVVICTRDRIKTIPDVSMLIDSGADLTLIPRKCVDELGLRDEPIEGCVLEGFDGSMAVARAVNVELHFLQYVFKGTFAVTEAEIGVLGRNVINRLSLVLDGPRLTWREATDRD